MSNSRIYRYECKVCGGNVTKPKLERVKDWQNLSPDKFQVGLGKWFCTVERKITQVKSSHTEGDK